MLIGVKSTSTSKIKRRESYEKICCIYIDNNHINILLTTDNDIRKYAYRPASDFNIRITNRNFVSHIISYGDIGFH